MKNFYLVYIFLTCASLAFAAPESDNLNQGNAYMTLGKFKKAVQAFEQAIKANPQNAEAYKRLGIAYYQLGDNEGSVNVEMLEKSINALQSAVKIKPDAESYYRLGLASLALNGSVDKLVIEKKARRLMLISKGEVIKTYKIALGGNPIGPKEMEGDNKTPEGTYFIDSRNENSRYHRSLHISYPNESDKKRAKELDVSPGGNIMIHGSKNGFSWIGDAHTAVDWTKGCIAVRDEEIDEIEKVAPNGTVVEIRP